MARRDWAAIRHDVIELGSVEATGLSFGFLLGMLIQVWTGAYVLFVVLQPPFDVWTLVAAALVGAIMWGVHRFQRAAQRRLQQKRVAALNGLDVDLVVR